MSDPTHRRRTLVTMAFLLAMLALYVFTDTPGGESYAAALFIIYAIGGPSS